MLLRKFSRSLLQLSSRTMMKRNVTVTTQKKGKKDKPTGIPCTIDISAIGHGFAGTPKCLVVNTSHFKYMFNCGEGTQRIATEHRKMRGTNRIFFTSGKWENVGGLIGISLTLETADVKKLHIYGPPGVNHHLTSSRSFSKLEEFDIVNEDTSVSFTDAAMTVDFIKLKKNREQLEHEPKRIKLSDDAKEKNDEEAIAYLCKPHSKPRNIDLEKCAELDIPAGPHLAILKEEKEVVLPGTDRVIKPDDVLTPKDPNDPFLIVECPSVDHIDSLISSPELLNCSSKVCLVVHFTRSSVMAHPLYVDWMKKFGPSTQHMVLNDLCSSLDTEAMHRLQAARNLVHPFIFPLLPHSVHPESHFINSKDHLVIKNEDKDLVHYARTNTRYPYRPTSERPFEEDQCLHLDTNKFLKDTLNESAQEFLKVWKKNHEGIERKLTSPEDPEIVFLGTGSAVPNKYRNVSCIMVNVGEEASIILDCGENSCGQLYRLYGPEETEKKLMKLRAIFISHLHADHHLGLIGFAIDRKKCFDARGIDYERLIVVAPVALSEWYSAISGDDIPINELISFVPAECLLRDDSPKPESYDKLLDLFGFEKVQTVRVQHSQFPHGVILKHNKGWKMVYSGDTMPSHELIRAGHDCDLLIHEATFDGSNLEKAKCKRHSTSEQAIEVGRKMKAKFILLTHFSQRYDKVPLFSKEFSDDVGVAFDNMIVKMSDLHLLPKFLPAYKVIYEEDYQEMMQNIENKHFRLEMAKGLV